MLKTKDIVKKYDISRQTLNNWIRKGKISRPQKNARSAYIWDKKNEEEIISIISEEIPAFYATKKQERLQIGNRRYLGSKQRMLDFINTVVMENLPEIESVADIFGGTGVVSDLFRKQGKKIIVNDILYSNFVSFQAWFSNEKVDINKIAYIIDEFSR